MYDPCPCNSGKKFKFCCNATHKCGLCGKKQNITLTECCNNLICDDEHTYILFSYANNSCSHNHRTGTLCAYHYQEGHVGKWQQCDTCKSDFSPEMYYYYAMSDYNFEKPQTPLTYVPVQCHKCHKNIQIGFEDCVLTNNGHGCERCYPDSLKF